MADKELGITVTGNLSDIEAKIQELTSLLGGINDVSIGAEADFEGVKGELANLQETLNTLDSEVITPEVSADGIADVSTEAESASGDMEDLGEAGEEAGSMIESGMAVASLAVLALGADVEETAQKLGDISVSYSKLGSSFEGGSAALRDQVANITDTEFPEDEALTYISLLKRMGVAQEDLVDSADDLNKIRSATQSSVSDMTPLLQGLRSMNYDVSNLEGAYNALYFANAKYVGGLPAFSSDLRKYGSYFEDMGLNIDQAAVILVEAQKKWPDPRQMRTHLKEALDQSGGDVNKFADALGIPNDKLKNAGNVTGEYAGKVESVSKQYGETATATQKVDAATADLNTRYGDITKTLYDAAGAVYTFTKTIGEAWLIDKAAFKVGILEEDYAAKFIEKPLMKGVDIVKGFGEKARPLMDDIGKILTKPFTKGTATEIVSPELLSGVDDSFAQMESKIAQKSGGFTDDLVRTLRGAVPKVKVPAGLIPEGIGSTLTKGISKIAPKVLGEGATIGILFGQGMYNALDNTKKGLGTLLVETFSLDLFKDVPILGDMVSQAEWFLNLIGTPEQWATVLVGKQNVEKMQAWLGGVQEWTRQSWDWIVAWVMNLPTAIGEAATGIYDSAVSLWNEFIKGFTEAFSPVTTLLSDAETTIKDGFQWLIDLPGKAWQWGWDIIDSWKKGLGDALDGSKQWIEDKLSYLSGLLEGHSPPKEGPLSEIDQWGVNIGRSFVEGIGEGIGISSSILSSALSGISGGFTPGSFALPAAATTGLSTSGSTIPVTINLTLPAMNSREEAVQYGSAAGQAAGQSLAEVLRGQATNAGVSTVNMMR
jgi:hypothetical protein